MHLDRRRDRRLRAHAVARWGAVWVALTLAGRAGEAFGAPCDPPAPAPVAQLSDAALRDSQAAAALDAVGGACFDAAGRFSGTAQGCAEAQAGCARSGRDFQSIRATRAAAALVAERLAAVFNGRRYRPRAATTAPAEGAPDCAARERETLQRAAAARRESAATLGSLVREHRSFETWLYLQRLDCLGAEQAVDRLRAARASLPRLGAADDAAAALREAASTRWSTRAEARGARAAEALPRLERLRADEVQRRVSAAALGALDETQRRLSKQLKLAAGYVRRAGSLARHANPEALAALLSGRLANLQAVVAAIDKPKLAGAAARTLARELHAPKAVQKVADRVAQSLVAQFERSEAARAAKDELESQWNEMRQADVDARAAFDEQVRAQRAAGEAQRAAHDEATQQIPPTFGLTPVLDLRGPAPTPQPEATARVAESVAGARGATFLPIEEAVDCLDAECLAIRAEGLEVEALCAWRWERDGATCAARAAALDATAGTMSFACAEASACDDAALMAATTRCAARLREAFDVAP